MKTTALTDKFYTPLTEKIVAAVKKISPYPIKFLYTEVGGN